MVPQCFSINKKLNAKVGQDGSTDPALFEGYMMQRENVSAAMDVNASKTTQRTRSILLTHITRVKLIG